MDGKGYLSTADGTFIVGTWSAGTLTKITFIRLGMIDYQKDTVFE